MLYKGSGSIFKQLMLLLSKVKNPDQLTFISSYFRKLIQNKEKVSRASQLLFNICEDNYKVYVETTEFVLKERIEINHNYITNLLNSVITLPEKYMLTSNNIQQYGIIDLEAELAQNNLQRLNGLPIYITSTREFNLFLVKTMSEYLEVLSGPESEGEESVKSRN